VAATETSLVDKVVALHDALASAAIAHAFGGALSLAYYTREPRATADVHINVTAHPHDARRVLEAGALDVLAAAAMVRSLIGEDPRVNRLTALTE